MEEVFKCYGVHVLTCLPRLSDEAQAQAGRELVPTRRDTGPKC